MKKKEFRDYQEKLLEDLQDPDLAEAYLNEALADEDPRMFLLALKNVIQARGEVMATVAKNSHLSRENLYRILSPAGNPKLSNVVNLLNTVGFSLSVHSNKR